MIRKGGSRNNLLTWSTTVYMARWYCQQYCICNDEEFKTYVLRYVRLCWFLFERSRRQGLRWLCWRWRHTLYPYALQLLVHINDTAYGKQPRGKHGSLIEDFLTWQKNLSIICIVQAERYYCQYTVPLNFTKQQSGVNTKPINDTFIKCLKYPKL